MEKEYLKSTTQNRKNKKDFATIDTETLEILTPMTREDIEKNSYSVITINSYKDNLYRIKVNIHNSNIDREPYKDLKSYIKAKRGIMERVQVVDFKNKRLDLCIDSMREFEKSKKLSNRGSVRKTRFYNVKKIKKLIEPNKINILYRSAPENAE